MFPPSIDGASADLLVSLFDEATIPDALALAAELRHGGVRVEVYPEPDKLGKQMKYAATRDRSRSRRSSAPTRSPAARWRSRT